MSEPRQMPNVVDVAKEILAKVNGDHDAALGLSRLLAEEANRRADYRAAIACQAAWILINERSKIPR